MSIQKTCYTSMHTSKWYYISMWYEIMCPVMKQYMLKFVYFHQYSTWFAILGRYLRGNVTTGLCCFTHQILDSKIKQMYKFVHIYVHYWLVWVYKFVLPPRGQVCAKLGVGCTYLCTKPVLVRYPWNDNDLHKIVLIL